MDRLLFIARRPPGVVLAMLLLVAALAGGCHHLPRIVHQPTFHNPFPQLTKVAIAPFFNLSTEPTVDGRQFALAYYNELQLIPGFEVAPIGIVEKTAELHQLSLSDPVQVRRLAQILEVDAVVIGAITDFSPYYPPRCGLQVEWYAANAGFHPVPPGYGLPWGTTDEEDIPKSLVFEAEFALARAQLKTQTPDSPREPPRGPPPERVPEFESRRVLASAGQKNAVATGKEPAKPAADKSRVVAASAALPVGPTPGDAGADESGLPADWPDPRGFVPLPPQAQRPPLTPTIEPVLRHTKNYNGHDSDFTAALENYVYFRNDARFGGWQSYLQRSEDFIRFCCHKHIAEMLTARGGAGETRVVWRWGEDR